MGRAGNFEQDLKNVQDAEPKKNPGGFDDGKVYTFSSEKADFVENGSEVSMEASSDPFAKGRERLEKMGSFLTGAKEKTVGMFKSGWGKLKSFFGKAKQFGGEAVVATLSTPELAVEAGGKLKRGAIDATLAGMDYTERAVTSARDGVALGAEVAYDAAVDVSEYAGEKIGAGAEYAKEKVGNAWEYGVSKVRGLKNYTAGFVKAKAEWVKNKSTEGARAVGQAVERRYNGIVDAGKYVIEGGRERVARARENMENRANAYRLGELQKAIANEMAARIDREQAFKDQQEAYAQAQQESVARTEAWQDQLARAKQNIQLKASVPQTA